MDVDVPTGPPNPFAAPSSCPAPQAPPSTAAQPQDAVTAPTVPSKRAASLTPTEAPQPKKQGRRPKNQRDALLYQRALKLHAAETRVKISLVSQTSPIVWTDELDSVLLQSVTFVQGLEQHWTSIMARLEVEQKDRVIERYIELRRRHYHLRVTHCFGTEHLRGGLIGPLPSPDSAPWNGKEDAALLAAIQASGGLPSLITGAMGSGRSLRCLTERRETLNGWLDALKAKLRRFEEGQVLGKNDWKSVANEMRTEHEGCAYTAADAKRAWNELHGSKPVSAFAQPGSNESLSTSAPLASSSLLPCPSPFSSSVPRILSAKPGKNSAARRRARRLAAPVNGPWSEEELHILFQHVVNGEPVGSLGAAMQAVRLELPFDRIGDEVRNWLRAAPYRYYRLPATKSYGHEIPRDMDYIGPKPNPDWMPWSDEEDAELLALWSSDHDLKAIRCSTKLFAIQRLLGSGRSCFSLRTRLKTLGVDHSQAMEMYDDRSPSSATAPLTSFDFTAFFASTAFPQSECDPSVSLSIDLEELNKSLGVLSRGEDGALSAPVDFEEALAALAVLAA
ncbi:hypothetical protein BCR35DRAFT_310322 [Leucosporidium creatinivorum]|uniref:Uncharacterized protein n=1 Tax=Leucosporidium creatinivorum TaxID=106004 RepID=A0A1Y2D5E2_9BASI|nr:hypothetical protein BCR35DRAFT_310322 [Leucosporidium creatinivorum]